MLQNFAYFEPNKDFQVKRLKRVQLEFEGIKARTPKILQEKEFSFSELNYIFIDTELLSEFSGAELSEICFSAEYDLHYIKNRLTELNY
jgi:hypothetical protein